MVRRVEFMGWREALPPKEKQERLLEDYDFLRIVILAEEDERGRWVEFKCADKMHAIKIAHAIKYIGFEVDAVARRDRVYVKRK